PGFVGHAEGFGDDGETSHARAHSFVFGALGTERDIKDGPSVEGRVVSGSEAARNAPIASTRPPSPGA
ncbi:hypothetical protein ABTK10_20360, partial [Acinetobacter baumannii]